MSVTTWLECLRAGDTASAEPLWQRYHAQLIQLAHKHLARQVCRAADEEDVALSAFANFCSAAAAGRYPRIENRHDLWRLLYTLTLCHARDLARHEQRQRRGGGRIVPACDLLELADADLDVLAGDVPDPGWAAAVADELAFLFAKLPNDRLRHIARMQLEGYQDVEIAEQLGCSLRTLERKWRLIRQLWLEASSD